MKKTVLSMLLLVSSIAMAQNVVFYDKNFKDYLVNNQLINTNGDDEIQVSEAEQVTRLQVYMKVITSLKGIEAFTAVETFLCQGNQVKTLDLSKNTALKVLWCQNNQIKTLDLSKNTALTEVKCSNNKLENLILSNGSNSSLAIEAIQNDNLSCVQVDAAMVNSQPNLWKFKAGTNFTTTCKIPDPVVDIPDANFKKFLVKSFDANGDGEIQDSEAKAHKGGITCKELSITSFKGLEAFTNITSIYVTEGFVNSLAPISMELTHNKALTYINIGGRQLKSVDISNLINLKRVEISSCDLVELKIDGAINLESLKCPMNELSTLDVSSHTKLMYLGFYGNNLVSVNIANGNNADPNFKIHVGSNGNLNCITVDNGVTLANVDRKKWIFSTGLQLFSTQSCPVLQKYKVTGTDVPNKGYVELFPSSPNAEYYANSTVLYSAVPLPGYKFVEWSGDLKGFKTYNNAYSEITKAMNLKPVFEKINTAGIKNIAVSENFTVFPNPVDDILNLQLEETLVKFEVYSVLGAKVLEGTKKQINVSGLASGVYVLKVYTQNNKVSTKQFIKK